MRLVDADKLFEKFRTTFPASEVFQILNQAPTVCDIEQIRDEIEESITDYILDEEDTNTATRMGDVMTKVFEIIDKYTKGENG